MEHEETKENLAKLEHDQWSHWMDYMFTCGIFNIDGSFTLPKEKVERWKRQMETKYKDLPEAEKESDREWANKALKAIKLVKLLKEENEFGRELGANYVLNVLLDQKKITPDDFIRLQ
ncbi:MAG: hypothetical protein KJI69_05115 [Patescibacteria group bacterium]|nr:hypothetical protein [Patescibacteria group bacterium]